MASHSANMDSSSLSQEEASDSDFVEQSFIGNGTEPPALDSTEVLRVVNKYINEDWELRTGQGESIVGRWWHL